MLQLQIKAGGRADWNKGVGPGRAAALYRKLSIGQKQVAVASLEVGRAFKVLV